MKRKTKIVCTLGPSSQSEAHIIDLIHAGMNVARFNFSHGSHEEHLARLSVVKDACKKTDTYLGLLADTKGPEIRVGRFENDGAFFKENDEVVITKEPVLGNNERFHIGVLELFDDIKQGDTILIDDGKMRLIVIDKASDQFKCVVKNDGFIKNNKGVNVPNVKLSMPFISKKDELDFKFIVEQQFDTIALSFVRRKQDVLDVRKLLNQLGGQTIELIAKIENQESIDNIDEILEVSDGIMVARGDLGVEIKMQDVPLYQKLLIQKANDKGKPVITATHMLESMMVNPKPTRAEASDVANAILDGSDAIMLSGETAVGKYPVESVLTMHLIAEAIENRFPYEDTLKKSIKSSLDTVSDLIGISVSQAAISLPKLVAAIAFTQTGGTARRLAKFRPAVPIIAVCENEYVCTRLSHYWGVFATHVESPDYLDYDEIASKVAKEFGYKPRDLIAITSGWQQKHGSTNTLRIIEIK